MTITGVSFLGQQRAQTRRLNELNFQMSELQRQLTTQKKSETFTGLGYDARTVQRMRMDSNHLNSYINNINLVSTRIQLMDDSMTAMEDIGREILHALQDQYREDPADMDSINQIATQGLSFVQDLMNLELDGRYLFSGSNNIVPFLSKNIINNNTQTQITDWLDGTQTTAQLLTNVNAFDSIDVGFDPQLSSSGPVTVQISKSSTMDYTSIANNNGFQDIIIALGMAANMKIPDGVTDVPTQAEFATVLDDMIQMVGRGIDSLEAEHRQIGGKFEILENLKINHTEDVGLFEKLTTERENVDTTEVIAQIQSLQTQLTSSYEVTSLLNQFSLINFI